MVIIVEKSRSQLGRFGIGLNYTCLPDYSAHPPIHSPTPSLSHPLTWLTSPHRHDCGNKKKGWRVKSERSEQLSDGGAKRRSRESIQLGGLGGAISPPPQRGLGRSPKKILNFVTWKPPNPSIWHCFIEWDKVLRTDWQRGMVMWPPLEKHHFWAFWMI